MVGKSLIWNERFLTPCLWRFKGQSKKGVALVEK